MAASQDPNSEKGMTALFVRRPVLAFVLNTLIVVAGLAALAGVEVREDSHRMGGGFGPASRRSPSERRTSPCHACCAS
jgi:hypothetical protein